jgi:hypothetical protein
MHVSRTVGVSFLALACAVGVGHAQTEPAAATQRAAITEHDVAELMAAFNQQFVVDAYKTGGRRDARWDADALAFLAAQARDGVTDDSDVWYRPEQRVPLADRVAMGRRARDAGCDDAIVLYYLGVALEATRSDRRGAASPEAAAAYAAASAAADRGVPYAKLFRMLIHRADWRANGRSGETAWPRHHALLRETPRIPRRSPRTVGRSGIPARRSSPPMTSA